MSTNGSSGNGHAEPPDKAAARAAAAAALEAAFAAEGRWRQDGLARAAALNVATLREDLLAHYGDLGPQYPLLVERLVQAHVRATHGDAQGEDWGQGAHIRAAEEVRRCVAALQRYTESLKQEIIAKRVEMQVVRVVEIIEAVVLPVAPQLWNDVIAALAERAPSLE